MGLVIYVSRRTGEELQADFPLHPTLVNATRPDGSNVQMMRDVWDQEWSQKLPDLPKVDGAQIPGGPPVYEPPTLTPIGRAQVIMKGEGGPREPLPTSHASWFALIYDQMVAIDKKLDAVIDEVSKPAPDIKIEDPPPQS
jgi:hypothetical protein